MARVLLYTGKGGVGKTSIAAATALRCSQRGLRTIVLSTDAAHSLGDSFDTRLSSPEPIEIAPRLWAQESDVYYNVEKYWGTVQRWIASVFAWDGVDEVLAEEMAVLPGMDELSSLLWILEHERSERFDAIIVDCAPTAEALRLLTLPDAGRWWVERIFPFGRRLTGIAQPIARRLTDLPLPGSEVFDASEEILRQVNRVQAILNDPEKTSVRLVINAEKMVISESQRTFTYLSLYNYRTDLVICNRMIPPGAADGYFDAWRAAQQRYLKLAEESFAPVPLRCVPFFDREVVGLEMLERVADELYGDDDPTTPLFQERPFTIEKVGDEYILEVSLPLASREEVSLLEAGEQLVIEVGPHRRTVMLPRMLLKQRALSARFDDGKLRVTFGGGTDDVGSAEDRGPGGAHQRA